MSLQQKGQLMLAINNMSGGQDEIDMSRILLENIIERALRRSRSLLLGWC